jgi:outer membrane protein OmpA-like peptidoglycan-associated protein
MQTVVKLGLLGAGVGALFACSYDPQLVDRSEVVFHELDAVRKMEPQGPAFNQGLRQGYLDYTDVMSTEYDYGDYWHFAFKAVDSAKGEGVLPDAVESRHLQPDSVEELSAARARLMAALDQTGRKKAPWPAAKAQTSFDCWLEKAEENKSPEQIKICKGEFESAIAEVERALTTEAGNYLVFFAWDQADLTPVAMAVLDQVQSDYLRARPARVTVEGHADRSGPEPYNEALSERRAENVARALLQRGLPERALKVEWFGEQRPRVPTPDGQKEPRNRRVQIVFG